MELNSYPRNNLSHVSVWSNEFLLGAKILSVEKKTVFSTNFTVQLDIHMKSNAVGLFFTIYKTYLKMNP